MKENVEKIFASEKEKNSFCIKLKKNNFSKNKIYLLKNYYKCKNF